MIKITPTFYDTLLHVFDKSELGVDIRNELSRKDSSPSIYVLRSKIEEAIDLHESAVRIARKHTSELEIHNQLISELEDMQQCYSELMDLINEDLDKNNGTKIYYVDRKSVTT